MGYEINPEVRKDIHRTKEDKCPYCGKKFDAAALSFIGDSTPPIGGDLSICFGCGGFLRFGKDLLLEKLPLEDFKLLEAGEQESLVEAYKKLLIYMLSRGLEDQITFILKKYLRGMIC